MGPSSSITQPCRPRPRLLLLCFAHLSAACGRKPAQEPSARVAVGTSWKDRGWLWQKENVSGTFAPALCGSSNTQPCPSVLGQLPSAQADLCWPTAAPRPRPSSCVASEKPPPCWSFCEEQFRLKQTQGRKTVRLGRRDGPGVDLVC